MGSIFIDDAFTLPGKVTPLQGVHPEINFTYRPTLPQRAYEFSASVTGRGPTERMNETVRLLVEQVTGWDAKDGAGNAIAIDARILRRVFARVLDQMLDAVLGYSPAARDDDEKK